MTAYPPTTLGQATMANSEPIAPASDWPAALAIGLLADAAVYGDSPGSLSAKLRALIALLDVGGDAVAAGQYQMRVGAHLRGYNGATWDRIRIPNIVKGIAVTAVTAGTPVTIWTPASGKKYRLMGYSIFLTVAAQVIFKDGGNGDAEHFRERNSTSTSQTAVGLGVLFAQGAAANGALKIDVTTSASISGFVIGTEE